MRAVVLPNVNESTILIEKPTPNIASQEALVSMHAASWNRRDHWITLGKYPGVVTPVTLGSDGCGSVEECPDKPDIIGEEIIICPSLNWGDNEEFQSHFYSILGMPKDGTFADSIAIPIENIVRKPKHLTNDAAAAIPLAGLTAWRAIHTKAMVKPGDRVLITGIGAGTAIFSMQFALAMGAEVIVTSSSSNKIQQAISLGAKAGVLYTEDKWGQQLQKIEPRGFDVIIDSAGGDGFGILLRLIGMGGRLVFFGGTRGKWPSITPQYLFFKQISILSTTMGSPKEFREMIQFIDHHKIEPVVDSIFDLSDHKLSLDRMNHPERFGKVVCKIQ